jgi:DNA-binding MarR family transcriptional regulator
MASVADEASGGAGRRGGAGSSEAFTPPEVLARNAGFLLGRVGQLAREELARALEPMGLKPRHYGVLAVLADEGPHPQRVLGEKLRIDRSTMVIVVDELEAMGLVERRRDRRDRRRYELTLTNAGGRVLSEALPVVESVEEAVLAPLDERRRRELRDSLAIMLQGLNRNVGE